MTVIRRPGAASAAVLVGLILSVGTVHAIAPDWSRSAGLDVWNFAALEQSYQVALEEKAAVNSLEERSTARRAFANQIAATIVANPSRLPTAADELVEVFQQDESMQFVLRTLFPEAPTDRHRFARHAIDRAGCLLVNDPARRETVLARLEAEYRAMCVSPESPPAP